ncbi:hypothetical protein V8E53_012329 [Lactarius tabidus]
MFQVPSTSTPSTNFETIFAAALKAYKKQTKKDIAAHPLATELQSCDSSSAILAILRAQVQNFDQSQGADDSEKWTKWLDPTVNVLFAFSATLGNGVGVVFPPANAIFTGIGVLLQAIKDVRASKDALVDLFRRMEYFFKRLEAYIKVRPTAAMRDIIVEIMIEVISILGIVTKEIREGRTKRYFKKLIGRKDVEDALQLLDKLTQEEARMAAAESLTITRRIDERMEGVDERLEGVDDRVRAVDHNVIEGARATGVAIQLVANQVSDLKRNELRKDLRKWVAPPDPSVNFNVASSAHHEGTAAWCTGGNTLAEWKISGSLLWIHGKPGSGKSILSSAIIRDIKSISNAGAAFLAYFYFDFKDTSKQDSRALLSSLLVQLSDQSDILCDILSSLHSAHKQGSEQPTDESLAQCLKDMLTMTGQVPIYLVIDALDECPNDSGIPSSREKVMKLVKQLVGLQHPNLRLCVTSRPEFDIRTTLKPLATQQVSLHDESGQKQDINDYVTSVVRSDERMKRWRDNDKAMVIEKLTAKADGMFRWVFCQLEVLRICFPANLRHTLEELPKSLDGTYKRILNEINNANRVHAYRLLQCLTVALRPLRVEELAEVLAFDLTAGGIPKLNADWRWEDQEEAVLSACSSLVSGIVDDGSRVVQFSHFSVKEFLTSDRLASCMEEVSQFHIPLEPSNMILAQACLGVLLCLDDRTDYDSIPLYQYAAEWWVGHARVGNVESAIKDALDYFFDMDNPHFSALARIKHQRDLLRVSMDEKPTGVPRPAAPLYFAAWKGFRDLAKRLAIKHPQHVNQLGGYLGTPLHASLYDNWTPLHLALHAGHLESTKWLLNHGADVNSQKKDGWTPLHLAGDNLEACRLLLEHNAEVDSRDNEGLTPFLKACKKRSSPDILQLFLEHNADVRVCDDKGYTPLHFEAQNGLVEVAQILLQRNADVNSQTNHGSTPLLLASEYGHPDVVQLLLGHNADLDQRDADGDTPLHCAAIGGQLEVARILLKLDVEVNSRNEEGSTPLHLAARGSKSLRKGSAAVVQLLLEYGADVQARDFNGKTASEVARGLEQQEIVRLLSHHAAE